MSLVLDVRGLAKTFRLHQLGRELPTLPGVSFTLDAGRFLLVRGPNGSGKSTLLRCLYRTYRPTGGSALLHTDAGPIDLCRAADVDIAALRRRELGHVTQFLRPRPRVPAAAVVAEPLLALGQSEDGAVAEAGRLLDAFGLSRDLHDAYPATFSGGEQQKVNLARALIRPRGLLLLDEPTASLDETAREALVSRLAELKQSGTAMLGVFHHPEDVETLIDGEINLGAPAGV